MTTLLRIALYNAYAALLENLPDPVHPRDVPDVGLVRFQVVRLFGELLKISMKTIYKYPLSLSDIQTVHIPRDGRILSVQVQGSQICLWAEVNVGAADAGVVDQRCIEIRGTGHRYDEASRTFIGTVQLEDGAFVLHVFERL